MKNYLPALSMSLAMSSTALTAIADDDTYGHQGAGPAPFMALTQDTYSHRIAGRVPFLTLTAQSLGTAQSPILPFINSSLPNPPDSQYKGPLFQLRHDYPTSVPAPEDFPWKKVTGSGPITQKNAMAYVDALKAYVSEDMRKLLFQYEKWNAPQEPWWQSIWLGTEREPIHGFYVGSGFPKGTLTGQTLDLTTYVLTLYDKRAAVTLGNIWGTTEAEAFAPKINNPGAQFAEGSVIVKFSFVTPCGADWAPMEGTAVWPIYAPLNESNGSGNNPSLSKCPDNGASGTSAIPTLTKVYMMQFDIIVKDSQAAPSTGWVFSTLIYDKDAPGKDAWDKMVPLGATWGNNPDVINTASAALTPPAQVNPKLSENWINLSTPEYARSTLGWDGRLSGPNDGAVITPAWAGSHYYPAGLSTVGCLGCHSTAQYSMKSFLLPTTTPSPAPTNAPLSSTKQAFVVFDPGSKGWMKWFQSRPGDVPMDAGQVALDYDMVTAFKAIPMWRTALKAKQAGRAEGLSETRK